MDEEDDELKPHSSAMSAALKGLNASRRKRKSRALWALARRDLTSVEVKMEVKPSRDERGRTWMV